jgi:UDP-3-O-[3-hydroxymyristoyl] glucosamine N-acyltransferase
MIATRGGLTKSIKKSGKYAGTPVVSLAEHNRTKVQLRKIDDYVRRIEALEKQLSNLKERLPSHKVAKNPLEN